MSLTLNKWGLSKEAWAKFCLVLRVVVYPVPSKNLRISGLWLSYENSLVLENSRRKNTTSKYNIYMIFSGFFFFFSSLSLIGIFVKTPSLCRNRGRQILNFFFKPQAESHMYCGRHMDLLWIPIKNLLQGSKWNPARTTTIKSSLVTALTEHQVTLSEQAVLETEAEDSGWSPYSQ